MGEYDDDGNRILEPYYKYLSRSAAMIDGKFKRYGKTSLVTKIVMGVFKEAWREGQMSSSLLSRQKCGRTRLWFDAIKDLPNRDKGITKQRRPGRVSEWEGPMVKCMGEDWRHKRDRCIACASWMRMCDGPIHDLLINWKLEKDEE